MKRKRRTTAVRHSLDQKLIETEATRFNLPPENLAGVLSVFGPLPEDGQRNLLDHLYIALGRYGLMTKAVRVITPSALRHRLRMIESTARKLLRFLGVDCNKAALSWFLNSPHVAPQQRLGMLGELHLKGRAAWTQLTIASINYNGEDEERASAESAAASRRTAEAVLSLLWLCSQSSLAAQSVRVRNGSGGSRNRSTPQNALIRDVINIYAVMRMQYPDSGNKPGYGGHMLRFIRAVAALAGTSVTDSQIKEVWRVRVSIQK